MRLFVFIIWTITSPPIVINGAIVGVKWNRGLNDFEPISGLISQEEEKQELFRQSRKEETHDFNGKPMRLSYYEDPGFFEFYDNDTKATGICGEIWTLLSEFLNFTLIFEKSKENSVGYKTKNGSFNGILRYAQLNEIDIVPKMVASKVRLNTVNISPVLWMNRQRIYALPTWNPNCYWIFDTFSVETWYIVLIFVVVLSLASFVMERVLIEHTGRKIQTQSYFVHLFHTLSTLCNQGNLDNIGSGSRTLNLTIRIFGWLVLVGYNARLINSLTQEVFVAPFSDFVTLLEETKIQILVVDGSFSHATFSSPFTNQLFRRILGANRVTVEKNLDDVYRKVCSEPDKYVLVSEEDAMAIVGIKLCNLIPVGPSYYMTPIVAGMSKRVKNKRTLDIGFIKLREFGLIGGLAKRYMSIRTDNSVTKEINNLAIDINRVSLLLALLGIGVVASIVICIAENIVYNTLAVRRPA